MTIEQHTCPFCDSPDVERVSAWGGQLITCQLRCRRCNTHFEALRDDFDARELPYHGGPSELPHHEGASELPHHEGASELPHPGGGSGLPHQEGAGELPHQEGASELPHQEGASERQHPQPPAWTSS
jgi:hypothetical protein